MQLGDVDQVVGIPVKGDCHKAFCTGRRVVIWAVICVFGTLIGAVFADLLFKITVLSIPMLLDRESDFVTEMGSSFTYVAANKSAELGWGGVGLSHALTEVQYF